MWKLFSDVQRYLERKSDILISLLPNLEECIFSYCTDAKGTISSFGRSGPSGGSARGWRRRCRGSRCWRSRRVASLPATYSLSIAFGYFRKPTAEGGGKGAPTCGPRPWESGQTQRKGEGGVVTAQERKGIMYCEGGGG